MHVAMSADVFGWAFYCLRCVAWTGLIWTFVNFSRYVACVSWVGRYRQVFYVVHMIALYFGCLCHMDLFFDCKAFDLVMVNRFTCNHSASPPGGNQVDGLPPA